MKTDAYLRLYVSNHFRKHLKICKCDICGCSNNLEVHHSGMQFFEIVDKACKDLNLKYYINIESYNNKERELLINYVLGIHIRSKYEILCENCHTKIHQMQLKKRTKRLSNISDIINFLNKMVGIKMFKEQKYELYQLIKIDYPSIRYMSPKCINEFFKKFEIPFFVRDKTDSGKRYIDKRRKLPNGENNTNRNKCYWILESL